MERVTLQSMPLKNSTPNNLHESDRHSQSTLGEGVNIHDIATVSCLVEIFSVLKPLNVKPYSCRGDRYTYEISRSLIFSVVSPSCSKTVRYFESNVV